MAWQRRVEGGCGGARRVRHAAPGRGGHCGAAVGTRRRPPLVGRAAWGPREGGEQWSAGASDGQSSAGEFVGIGAQLCWACYSFSLGCLLLPRWSWVKVFFSDQLTQTASTGSGLLDR